MAASWAQALHEFIRGGIIKNSIYPKRKVMTAVVPQKGMLVRRMPYYFYDPVDKDGGEYFLILDALTDEGGNCKFKYLASEQLQWTEWMSVHEFNRHWQIFNPWV